MAVGVSRSEESVRWYETDLMRGLHEALLQAETRLFDKVQEVGFSAPFDADLSDAKGTIAFNSYPSLEEPDGLWVWLHHAKAGEIDTDKPLTLTYKNEQGEKLSTSFSV